MAHETLAASFPSVFHTPFTFVDQVTLLVDAALLAHLREQLQPEFHQCSWESPESSAGACDGEPCGDPATVHHLGDDVPYCAKHFRLVSLRGELEALRG